MKFAVHWAPSVNVWTPGWSGAVAAGAQADALPARASSAATARSAAASIVRVFKFVSPVENGLEVRLAPSWGQRFFVPRAGAPPNTAFAHPRAQPRNKSDAACGDGVP